MNKNDPIMKKIMLCLLATIVIVGCSTTMYNADGTKMTKEQIRAARTQHVLEGIANRQFKINVDRMIPMRMPARHLSSLYSLEVKGDTIVSYLPYLGRAYSIPYGGGKGLNFTGIMSFYEPRQGRKNEIIIEIGVENEADTYVYQLKVFDNGNTDINVQSRNRDYISFSGEME